MEWVTKSHLHLDRVATSWLILRFVDPAAEFRFLSWGKVGPWDDAGPIPFGIRGVALSSHDDGGTTFAKVQRTYELHEPALERLGRIVDAGVRRALGQPPTAGESAEEASLGVALGELGLGFGMTFSDHDHLEHAMPLYDALYSWCRFKGMPEAVISGLPSSFPDRVDALQSIIRSGAEGLSR